ncbi:hypothetical protein LGH70_06765 [Hymenobacter sp. BT635]|uniref:Uncharacterized protein n=1 Tax=Hymenobacter nitidus TaxID=2880929 RepID=A0ABS8AC22_9BACT|nr:hypothetical protein [Hymenobacter nitidus]MCB2377277.1 hypothetical protein [Hymenobacter nitidus]
MDRNIYNQSQQPWTFTVTYDEGGNSGNVYFSGAGTGTAENGPWVVPANADTQTQFTTTDGKSDGTFLIADHTGQTRQFDFSGGSIAHNGDTGPVSLNTPADCDMTITADQW